MSNRTKRKDVRLTDAQLLDKVKNGDTYLYREIVERYEPQIAATVYGMLGSCPEAEDVGQETFIRFYNNIKNFRGESSIGTYLTRIAINLSLNELKRRHRRRIVFPQSTDEMISTPSAVDEFKSQDARQAVQMALEKLPLEFRSVIVLRLIDGYSTKETAEILNIPQGTVLSRLARAQKKLASILKELINVPVK
ncbi:RNA polymerase sigma factor [candidate division KSB1 bacterium]|nr:RNA polymerase sigma factor [candidate division KSB1 bacterium]